ncbi:hypothetical protein [Solirubrobacter soli]|uniref:hypothetical protein n=1 Tax=Solirubrobacter soli TaxID=363832 RepID=UPI0012F9DC80|nr:hypothetical protein [Solirubrobacter soli]
MVTRRALLGAGALALLAGCGPQEEPPADASAVLSEQLRLTQAVADAYSGVAGEGGVGASRRVEKLEAALRAAGGTPPRVASGATGVEAALAAEQAALRGHVAAVGELEDPTYRELLAGLIADAAASESALLTMLKRPAAPTAFPGQPV